MPLSNQEKEGKPHLQRLRQVVEAAEGDLFAGDDIDPVAKPGKLDGRDLNVVSVFEAVGQHAAGAIVGSALVEVLEKGEDPQPFLRALIGQ